MDVVGFVSTGVTVRGTTILPTKHGATVASTEHGVLWLGQWQLDRSPVLPITQREQEGLLTSHTCSALVPRLVCIPAKDMSRGGLHYHQRGSLLVTEPMEVSIGPSMLASSVEKLKAVAWQPASHSLLELRQKDDG